MKLLIIYEADFEDRESFETLFQVITEEGIAKGIIPSAEFMRDRLPPTVQSVARRLQFIDNDIVAGKVGPR